jgi:hypothetical protein
MGSEEIGWVVGSDYEVGLGEQPVRVATEVPLGATVGSRTEQHIHTLLLADANESGDIRIPLKIKLSAFWLMDVPENVGGNGVKPHGLGHANTGSPKFVGNPRKMDFSGQNLKWMSVQKELATRDLRETTCSWMARQCYR